MIDRYKLPFAFDPARLKDDLSRIGDGEWIPHFNIGYYDGDWSGVVLRGQPSVHPTLVSDAHTGGEYIDFPVLERLPYMKEVLGAFPAPLRSVRLLRLGHGSTVKEHRDYDLGYEAGLVRIHVPVQTNPGVEFHLNNRRVLLCEGEVWYLDLAEPHRVRNRGTTHRVHLVIDLLVNKWLKEQLPLEAAIEEEEASVQVIDPEAASANFEQFRTLVRMRADLQEALRDISDRELFLRETVRLGAREALPFDSPTIDRALRNEQRIWLERWIS